MTFQATTFLPNTNDGVNPTLVESHLCSTSTPTSTSTLKTDLNLTLMPILKLKIKLNQNSELMNVENSSCFRLRSDLVTVVTYGDDNNNLFNILMICPQIALFSSYLAIKNYIKATKIRTFPHVQDR